MSKQNMDDTNFTFRSLSHDEYKYTIFFNFHTNVLVVMDNYALYKPMYHFVAIISDINKKKMHLILNIEQSHIHY